MEEGFQHEVVLGGRGAIEHVVPTHIAVRSGSRVDFVTADHRIHTVTFLLDDMTTAAREFLRRTDQVSSPPLITRGTRFVVTFADAPTGFYPFRVRSHGDPVDGAIVVE